MSVTLWKETTWFGEWRLCEIFLKKYKPNTRGTVISCVKEMDSSSLPLHSRVIKEKLKRTNYKCSIWNNATIANSPNICGWVLKNSTFKIQWLEGGISRTTVKIISPENVHDVSSVINVIVYLRKKNVIIMKTAMTNPIMIMIQLQWQWFARSW